MAEDKSRQKAQAEPAKPEAGEGGQFVGFFRTAYTKYFEALSRRQQEGQRRQWSSQLELGTELQAIQHAAQEKIARALRDLHESVAKAQQSQDPQVATPRIAESIATFERARTDAILEIQQRGAEVWQKFGRSAQDLAQDVKAHSDVAYREFLQAAASAWQQSAPGEIGPGSLALATQVSSAVALAAAYTRGLCASANAPLVKS